MAIDLSLINKIMPSNVNKCQKVPNDWECLQHDWGNPPPPHSLALTPHPATAQPEARKHNQKRESTTKQQKHELRKSESTTKNKIKQ